MLLALLPPHSGPYCTGSALREEGVIQSHRKHTMQQMYFLQVSISLLRLYS